MRKLVRGIIEFRKNMKPGFRETFAKLALGQSPDALFVACSDSRVAPNAFASTHPGDLFVVRNVGNMIPPAADDGLSDGDDAEAAAIEFAIGTLGIDDIIVCGHSECGAMQAVYGGLDNVQAPHLRSWLNNGLPAFHRLKAGETLGVKLAPHNCLSQLNVLEQLDNLMTYPLVRDRVAAGKLQLHAWWFDIARAEVQAFDQKKGRFVLIDDSML